MLAAGLVGYLRLSLVLAVVLLALLLFVWVNQRRMIYFPVSGVPSPGELGAKGVEDVTFATEDGLRLGGWFLRPQDAPTGDTAVVFNGNAGHRAYRLSLGRALADAGIATLLFDYRGYGDNPGSPTETGLARDARAARRYLASRPDVDPRRLVYVGESLGAAVALGLALEHPPRALVLRSPFTSLGDVGAHHYWFLPVRWLLRDRYASLSRVRQLHVPLLVITAEHDSIVPADQSRRLYAAAPGPKRLLVLPGVDHNDYELLAGPQMIHAITQWLKSQ